MKLSLSKSVTALATFLAVHAACANEYDTLIKAKKFQEAERAANARLAREPGNPEAMTGKIDAILRSGDESRIDEAAKLAQQCVDVNPRYARCHLLLAKSLHGKVWVARAPLTSADARRIHDEFKKAIELDPHNIDARFSLLAFYRMGQVKMSGGSEDAEKLAGQTALVNVEAGKLIKAMIDLDAGRMTQAETAAMGFHSGSDEELNKRQEDLLISIAGKYLGDKKPGETFRWLRIALKRFPDSEEPPYLIARIQQDQGRHQEAIAGLEQMLVKQTSARVHYRIGKSLQVLGDKVKAIKAFETALNLKTGLSNKELADSETQIAALKG